MAGVEKALAKIQKNVESGNHYEAQQMLKTVYHRHRARKQMQESYQVLKGGAVMQLENKQVTCGVELGLLLMVAYTTDKLPASDESMLHISDIIRAFPGPATPEGVGAASAAGPSPGASPTLDELARFVGAAVKWALKYGSGEESRLIQDLFGQHIWLSYGWRFISRASKHFIRGQDARLLASALNACRLLAAPEEADLLVCRAALQAVAIASSKKSQPRQVGYAQEVLMGYLKLAQDSGVELSTPLIHFADMFLTALNRGSLSVSRLLRQKYVEALAVDPVLGAYLDAIERSYFGTGDNGSPFGGMLDGLMKDLLGGDGDSDDDDE